MHKPHHLALIARFPSPGQGKTRLIPRLGLDGACSFARAALTDLLHLLSRAPSCHRTLFYTPESARADILQLLEQESIRSLWDIHPQAQTPDIGGRLHAALEHARTVDSGTLLAPTPPTPAITFIGMDCFELTTSIVQGSMARVSTPPRTAHMLPACDGGYVLLTIPLDCDGRRVFGQIPWSSSRTGCVQVQRLEEAGLSCVVGEALPDVDEPGDLDMLWESRQAKWASFPRTMGFLETVMPSERCRDDDWERQCTTQPCATNPAYEG
ncbi:hypothetical protein PHISP_05987 [Aspergillus sp. HF37]|nr:hypothetical protein PHISP_05987 [Aspergillus sp. HF37]